MGRDSGSGSNHSHSSVDFNRRKHFSRFPIQTRHIPVDFHVKERHVLSDSGSFPTAANLGCLRLPLVGPTPSLYVMAQGSSCCGSGCFAGSMGPSNIPVPTGSLAPQHRSFKWPNLTLGRGIQALLSQENFKGIFRNLVTFAMHKNSIKNRSIWF